jgi:DMSO/TMAO reductase YedYZ molybdopterin-dependent catalytic subunit
VTKKNAHRLRGVAAGGLAGLLAAAVALGVAQLVAGLTGPQGSPVVAVGGVAINLTPVPVKDFVIAHVGTHDKQVLVAGILVILAAFAALIGVLARRREAYGVAGLAVFAGLGVAAAVTRPDAALADALPAIAGTVVAAFVLLALVRAAPGTPAAARRRGWLAPGPRPPRSGDPDAAAADPAIPGPAGVDPASPGLDPSPVARRGSGRSRLPGRRRFLALGAGAAGLAAASAAGGALLQRRFSIAALRSAVRLPAPVRPAPPVPAGTELDVPGITPFLTSSSSFYRVDTDIVLPQVSPDQWVLRVHGMVSRPLEISFDELLRRPLTEADITLACVSNEVGGHLAGNARWLGAGLARLLREAGVRSGADQILSTSTEGMTISTPVAAVIDDPDAMIAVGMNGQPLPVAHGFPARMMVPGLYGYVSGTKWVTDLKLTTFASEQAYWTQRGYTARAPIKTFSRIDVPRPLQQIKAGATTIAGIAWAPHRGIDAVEVQIDSGPWQQARLAAVPSIDTWRQWSLPWDAPSGLHQLQVRATDGTGATQTSARVGPFPNGATGWDSTAVTVT